MEFFNKKEEVIDFQLTQHGKYLLSQGVLKPVYYAFFDENILYESKFGQGLREGQNETEDRIRDTPNLKTQYLFRGAEFYIYSHNKNMISDLTPGVFADDKNEPAAAPTPDKMYTMQLPLGTMALDSRDLPAWNVRFYKTPLKSYSQILSGTSAELATSTGSVPNIRIPQVGADIKYEFRSWSAEAIDPLNYPEDVVITCYDSSLLELKEDFILLTIEEKGGISTLENYDIELFEVEEFKHTDGWNTVEKYKQLLFLDEPGALPYPHHVGFYFDISIDKEIDSDILCKYIGESPRNNIFTPKDFECPDKDNLVSANIYGIEPEEECQ